MTTADASRTTEPLRVDLLTRTFLALQEASGVATDLYFGVLLRLEGTPVDIDTLRMLVGDKLESLPALMHRLVPARGGGLCWERDPAFDLRAHIGVLAGRDVRPEPAGVWLGPDPGQERPLWRMWLLPGDGETWGIGYVVHHAAQDGTAVVSTLERFFGDGNSSAANPKEPEEHRPLRAWAAVRDLFGTLLPAAEVTALPATRGDGRRVTWRTVPLSELRSISTASGATTGQVHLAALAGAIRRWSSTDFTGRSRLARRALAVCVPVDIRRPWEDGWTAGSRIGLMRVALPCGEPDPRRRLRAVMTRASRDRVAACRSASRALTGDLPPRIGAAWLARLGDRRNVALTASSFRSVGPLTVAGSPVEQVIAIPWLPPGHSCFSILTRYREHASLSILTADGTGEPAELAGCWVEELGELQAAYECAGGDAR